LRGAYCRRIADGQVACLYRSASISVGSPTNSWPKNERIVSIAAGLFSIVANSQFYNVVFELDCFLSEV
jgi:hypothetical protein